MSGAAEQFKVRTLRLGIKTPVLTALVRRQAHFKIHRTQAPIRSNRFRFLLVGVQLSHCRSNSSIRSNDNSLERHAGILCWLQLEQSLAKLGSQPIQMAPIQFSVSSR